MINQLSKWLAITFLLIDESIVSALNLTSITVVEQYIHNTPTSIMPSLDECKREIPLKL